MTPRQLGFLLDRDKERRREADRRAGEIVAMLYNSRVDPKKDPRGITWQDVFGEWKEAPRVQTDEEMFRVMMRFAERHNRTNAA